MRSTLLNFPGNTRLLSSIGREHQRTCSVCKKKMREGYICDDGYEYYCSDNCLTFALNEAYGEGNWGSTEEENSADGYYFARDSKTEKISDLPIFYTEWEEEKKRERPRLGRKSA